MKFYAPLAVLFMAFVSLTDLCSLISYNARAPVEKRDLFYVMFHLFQTIMRGCSHTMLDIKIIADCSYRKNNFLGRSNV